MDISTMFVRLQEKIKEEKDKADLYTQQPLPNGLHWFSCGKQALAGDLLIFIEKMKKETEEDESN